MIGPNDPQSRMSQAILKGNVNEAISLLQDPALSSLMKNSGFAYSAAALAIIMDMPELLAPLLANGADVNYKTPANDTLLHMAARTDRLKTVRILLDKGANPLSQDNEGMMPWELAKHPETIALLYDAGERQSAQIGHERQCAAQHRINLERLDKLSRPRRPAP